ncbi:class A beta-lactamase-related serine hydrolase [Chitinophaga pendula]|uniref:serine hydrolase n=1 Tax=Chitinophaga TaxID=79328 RepID=UPI0018DF3230|nr:MULTISPECIES: serine hydrolase [Chitinophaga]UCJ06836.1 class A beta-lactamase-related serine hydrolase [Chitinophaga pendula]
MSLFAQQKQVDQIIGREMKERRIPGLQIAVVHHGKIVASNAYGIANLSDNIPVNSSTIFAINSCTKPFTGVAIMQLVEEGKIDLSAPVSRYIDSLPANWQTITIRQLLTHVSGLPDVLRQFLPTNGLGNATEEDVWTKLQTLPMDFPTGTQTLYNQTNYVLLAKIIDKLSGQPFTQFYKDRQWDRVGMPNTGYGDSRDVVPHFAPTYRYVQYQDGKKLDREKMAANYAEFPPFSRAGSGMNSTAEDIAKWTIALMQGKLFKNKATLDTMWTVGRYNNGKPGPWALGWGIVKNRTKHKAIGMSGGGRAAFLVYPEDELAVIVLTNLGGGTPEDFIEEIADCYVPGIAAADPVTFLRTNIEKQGYEKAITLLNTRKKADPTFQPDENALNDWAYRLMSKGKDKEAEAIFRLNTVLFPDSWNVYDSYGEVLLKMGDKAGAIKAYQKSITLNPDNEYGKKVLEGITK